MKPLVVDGPRMSDITQPAESRLLAEHLAAELARNRTVLGVHLWTHSPRRFADNPDLLRLLSALRSRGIPVALQVTVTGLGATAAEPGIEPTHEAFAALAGMLERELLAPDRICLRIDPIQAWHGHGLTLTNADRVDAILRQAHALGVRRARVSLIVLGRYAARIEPRASGRGLHPLRVDPADVAPPLRVWTRRGLDVRSCACELSSVGVPPGACFDFTWVTGRPATGPLKPVAPRIGCGCTVPEEVLLWKVPRRSACAGGCLACYAQEHSA